VAIPPLDPIGLLPPGIHDCTLAEIQRVFCGSARRIKLFGQLNRFIQNELPHIPGATIYVDGSFVRSKPDPDDVDLILDLSLGSQTQAESNFFKTCAARERWKSSYHVDVYPYHPDLPKNLVSYFQYVGIKAAAELNIPSQHPKGILRLT
jgi:hypothetical protein